MRAMKVVVAAALFATVACGVPAQGQSTRATDAPAAFATPEPARRAPMSSAEVKLSLAPVAAQAGPAVVNVYAQRIVRSNPMLADPFFRRFGEGFGIPRERVEQSLGSGVIVRADGVIVTNNHVIAGGERLRVALADRREFDAELIIADPQTDLAVLKLQGLGEERLPTLAFADARSTKVGDFVIAIGNPFGLSQTVTSGIVSALARTGVGINDFSFFIQTDAAINRGNSGGALIDLDGNLVGINTAIFSESGGSNGIGFAIPSALVRRVVESALSDGRVVRPWLGVRGQAVTQDLARSLGLDRPQGVIIADIYDGGPLAKAGLRRGDVVLSVNGEPVFDEQGLRFQAATLRPGAQTEVVYMRGSSQRTAIVKAEPPPRVPAPDPRDIAGRNPFQGARVVTLSPALAEELSLDPLTGGVAIQALDPRGGAARLGFQPGDIIRAINNQEIRTTRDLEAAAAVSVPGWVIVVERNGERATFRVRA